MGQILRGAVGAELRRVRRSIDLPMKQLAARLGLGYMTVNSYEHGLRNPPLPKLVQLCMELGVYAPDVLAAALQLSRVDLSVVAVDPVAVLHDHSHHHPLYQWAQGMVATLEGSTMVRLTMTEVFTLAEHLKINPHKLLDYIVDLTPQPLSRRVSQRG